MGREGMLVYLDCYLWPDAGHDTVLQLHRCCHGGGGLGKEYSVSLCSFSCVYETIVTSKVFKMLKNILKCETLAQWFLKNYSRIFKNSQPKLLLRSAKL
jgi:hypothetical protein